MEKHFILYFINNHDNTREGQRDFMALMKKFTQRDITGQKKDTRPVALSGDFIEGLNFDYQARIN